MGKRSSPGPSSPTLIRVRARSCSRSQRLIETEEAPTTRRVSSATTSSTSSSRCAAATALATAISARSSDSGWGMRSGTASASTAGAAGRPSSTRTSAATVRGQNCEPAWRRSSARAAASGSAARYGRSEVIACQASQARQMRLAIGMSAPASPSGYPPPSQRSCSARTAAARCASDATDATTRSPIAGCARMMRHSASLSAPGFCRIASGTPSFPTSCRSATCATLTTSSSASPSCSATAVESSTTASECSAV